MASNTLVTKLISPLMRMAKPVSPLVKQNTIGTTLFIFVVIELLSGLAVWDFGEFWVKRVADSFSVAVAPIDETNRAVVPLLISDEAYENDFRQTSPLNRMTMAGLIRDVGAKAPHATLLIDLDLSPRSDAIPPEEQRYLDEELGKLGPRLVLITPDRAMTAAVAWDKVAWVRKMCGAGVRFGSPLIRTRYGAVDPEFDPQGTLARTAAFAGPAAPCEVAGMMTPEMAPLFWDATGYNPAEDGDPDKKHQLQSEYFSSGNMVNLTSVKAAKSLHALSEADYVVLGGGWGLDDVFVTAAGDRYGAEVHAATLYSIIHPIRPPIFALNAFLGLFLVAWLAPKWLDPPLKKHFHYFGEYQKQCFANESCDSGNTGKLFLGASFWLLLFLVSTVFFVLLLFLINTFVVYLFSYDIAVAKIVFALLIGLFVSTPSVYRGVCAAAAAGPNNHGIALEAGQASFKRAAASIIKTMDHGLDELGKKSVLSGLANILGGISLLSYIGYTICLLARDFF